MNRLKRILSLRDLVAYGVGGTIGAGIFVSIGVGAMQSGPALFISFLFAALACSISGLCFCEMASRIPASGSSYSYALFVLGDFPAFVVGSVLVLDSVISAAACARAWSSYVRIVLPFLPPSVFADLQVAGLEHMFSFSLLSGIICIALGIVLSTGIKETTWFNNLSTALNVLVLAVFVFAGLPLTDSANWTPFAPHGVDGIVRGAGRIFFAFLGFDVVNCLAEETGSDAKAMVPRAIVLTILLTTFAYVLVSVAFVGLAPINKIDPSSPLSSAFDYRGYGMLGYLVGVGAVGNTLTSVLSNFLVQPRIVIRMAADGFLPSRLADIDDKGVPTVALWVTVGASTLTALFVDFETLADMVSVASLVSLSMVCVCSVLVRVQPQQASFQDNLGQHDRPTSTELVDDPKMATELNQFKIMISTYVGLASLTAISLLHGFPRWLVLVLLAVLSVVMAAITSQFNLLPHHMDASTFAVPFSPILPLLGVGINMYLLFGLPTLALVRAAIVFVTCAVYYKVVVQRSASSISRQTSLDNKSHVLRRLSVVGKPAAIYDTLVSE